MVSVKVSVRSGDDDNTQGIKQILKKIEFVPRKISVSYLPPWGIKSTSNRVSRPMLLRLPLSNLAGIRNGFMGTTELSYLAVFDLYTLGRTAQLVARAASRKVLWNTDNRSISRCGKGFFLLELTISSGFFSPGVNYQFRIFSPGVNYQFRIFFTWS